MDGERKWKKVREEEIFGQKSEGRGGAAISRSIERERR